MSSDAKTPKKEEKEEEVKAPPPPPPLYNVTLKAQCDEILKLEQLTATQEPFIPFGEVVTRLPQWWIKPDSSQRHRSGRSVRIKWDTPAQKVFWVGLEDAFKNYREAYLQHTGGRNFEEECDVLKAKVRAAIVERMKTLANKNHVKLSYFERIYQHVQTQLEKKGGRFVQWRTEAVHVPAKVLATYLRQVRARNFTQRANFPYCLFCKWIGHSRDTCEDYAKADTCSFCRYKGHTVERCYKAPICEHCLEKGHEEKYCRNAPRCRFCRTKGVPTVGHTVNDCEKLKRIQCHKCGNYGHTASRCFEGVTFDDDDSDEEKED